MGFAEPIGRFRYGLADWYPKYENEWRCANTYHLMRKGEAGGASETRVSLYYQPVLYLDETEENGIGLHRVPARDQGDEPVGEFWTPDYLLVVRQDGEERAFLMDAKYCSRRLLNGKMHECMRKYVCQTGVRHATPGTGVSGVVLLAGRMDAPQLSVSTRLIDGREYLRAIAPFNKNAGKRKVRQLFAALGIA